MSYYIYKYINDDGTIAYIGKTERLRERIKQHAQEVKFDGLKIIQYAELESKEEMDFLEKYFINYYSPYLNVLRPNPGKVSAKIEVDWHLWNEPVTFREVLKEDSKKEDIFSIPVWVFKGEQKLTYSQIAIYIWYLLVSHEGVIIKEKGMQKKMLTELEIKTRNTARDALVRILETNLLIEEKNGYKINSYDGEVVNISRFSLEKILNHTSGNKGYYFCIYLCLILFGKTSFYKKVTFSSRKLSKDGMGVKYYDSNGYKNKVSSFLDDFKDSGFLKMDVAKKHSQLGYDYNEYQVTYCYDFIWNKA